MSPAPVPIVALQNALFEFDLAQGNRHVLTSHNFPDFLWALAFEMMAGFVKMSDLVIICSYFRVRWKRFSPTLIY